MALEEFYTITIDGSEEQFPKGAILTLGILNLGLSASEPYNPFNYDTLQNDWVSDQALPSEQELIDAGTAHLVIEKSFSYQGERRNKYPSVQDQLDMLYHDIKAGTLETGDWSTAIEAVKAANPKP